MRWGGLIFLLLSVGCSQPSASKALPLSADELRGLAGVADVEVSVASKAPTRRIVQIRDWHLVTKSDFAADVGSSATEPMSDDETDRRYEEHLRDVERVQAEHKRLLTEIIDRYGISAVYVEGLTNANLPIVMSIVEDVRKATRNIDDHDRRFEELQRLRREAEAAGLSAESDKALELQLGLTAFRTQYRLDCLRIGAAGVLYAEGKLREFLPVEGAAEYDAANPLRDGKVEFNKSATEARHDAQVRRMRDGPPVAIIVLGGAHDLSESIQRLRDSSVEYLRLTSEAFREVAGN